jgi:hypothetical protein
MEVVTMAAVRPLDQPAMRTGSTDGLATRTKVALAVVAVVLIVKELMYRRHRFQRARAGWWEGLEHRELGRR